MTIKNLSDDHLSDEDIYISAFDQIKSLISKNIPILSNLSNFTSVLNLRFPKISWVGFYILKNRHLYLGPFQGKPACSIIKPGKGVCGACIEKKSTVIVEDVNKFPDHIACDSEIKSEIVVPVFTQSSIFGILDIDSCEYSAFNETDKKYLEDFCAFISKELNLPDSNLLT